MDLLFVVDSLSAVAGANVSIVRTLTKVLKKRDCKIYILAKMDCKRPVSEDIIKEFDEVYLLPSDKVEIIPNLYKRVKTNNRFLKETLWLLNHPGILFKGIDGIVGNAYFVRKEFTRMINRICAVRNIDAVIGVSSPYSIARAVSKANIKATKILYQLDPFTNNYTLSNKGKRKRRQIERQTIEGLDMLFMPDFIKDDIVKSNIYPNCKKLIEANLPGIIMDQVDQFNHALEYSPSTDKVNFVFAGRMYKDIRNPRMLFQLFTFLPDNYVLHILGSGCEKEIAEFKTILGERLIYHGLVAKKIADQHIEMADVLVNIDNTIKNQMPSKIVDYICRQKRIVNVCSDSECLAAKLLSSYPNGINVCVDENNMGESAKSVVEFMNNKIEIVTTKEILDKYKKYSDYYVADTFLGAINEFIRAQENQS